jgi:hypothetical protein
VSFFERLRRFRLAAVWSFVTLVLLVSAERRVAELHFNLRVAGNVLENGSVLDADEIRTRLIILSDDKVPTIPRVARLAAPAVGPRHARPALLLLDASASRGPPSRLASPA